MGLNTFSDGGLTASHDDVATQQVKVSSSTSDQQNRVRTSLIPIACFRVDDVRFEFDSSFVLPEAADEMKQLARLRQKHKLPPHLYREAVL
jgi:outer membrane protein OmpA-like peptidoglycan-associated protein